MAMLPEPIRPLEQLGWPHRDRLTSRCVSDSCAASDDSEIPRSRIPLATGNRGSSSTLLSCSASRDLSEVSKLYLQRNRSPASAGALAVAPHRVDDVSKRITCIVVSEEIGGERI